MFIHFLIFTAIAMPYLNASQNLTKRQDCTGATTLCQAFGSGCCPTGAACCSLDDTNVIGCCPSGFVCGFQNQNTSVCMPTGGTGESAVCGQGEVSCSNYSVCCPDGEDCYIDSNLNLRCSSAPPPPPAPAPTPVSSTLPPSATLALSSKLQMLYQCSPCGQSTCMFTGDGSSARATFDLIIGATLSNCQGKGSVISETVVEAMTFGSTWSVDNSVGLSLGPLNIGGGGGWSKSSSIEHSQSISLSVNYGQKSVVIATVTYQQTNGSLQVDSRDPFTITSNQPTTVEFSAKTIPCSSRFSANISGTSNCPSNYNSNTGMQLEERTSFFVSTIVLVIASMYLLA